MLTKQIIDVIMSHTPNTRLTPSGRYPKCRPALGSYYCERCGTDVRENTHKACKAVPETERWEFVQND